MNVQPYLFFNGRCEEALNFYRDALGAEVLFKMRFKEAPESAQAPKELADKIMHSRLKIGESELMASDGQCDSRANTQMNGCSMSLSPKTVDEAERIFNALAKDGTVTMPLQQTFWASRFGMLTDRFGVAWMVNCEQQQH